MFSKKQIIPFWRFVYTIVYPPPPTVVADLLLNNVHEERVGGSKNNQEQNMFTITILFCLIL